VGKGILEFKNVLNETFEAIGKIDKGVVMGDEKDSGAKRKERLFAILQKKFEDADEDNTKGLKDGLKGGLKLIGAFNPLNKLALQIKKANTTV